MNGNDDLFQLIKSMSKSEKRYFKLDAQKSTSKEAKNKYVQLFDAINSMDDYDETKLKKKAFVKHLSVEKGELYRKILRSMRSFRSDKSMYAQIKEMILDASYLTELGLVGQAEKMLKRAKNIAYQIHHHLAVLEINREERYLTRAKRDKEYSEEIDLLINEKHKILQNLNDEMLYLDMQDQLFNLIIQHFKLKDDESKQLLQNIIDTSESKNIEEIESRHAHKRLFKSRGFYHFLLGDFKNANHYLGKVIEWWDEHPKIKKEEFARYVADLSNLLSVYFNTDQYDKIPKVLQEMQIKDTHTFHEQSTLFYASSLYKLNYHMNTCDFETARSMVPSIEKGLKNFRVNPANRMVLTANISNLFFILQDNQKCKDWIQKFLISRKSTHRQDIQQSFRILYLITMFELGDERLEAEFRVTQRYFQKHTKLTKDSYEITTYEFLKKINAAVPSEQKQLLQVLKNDLQKLIKNPDITHSVGLDELMLWIESKLTRKSIVEIMHAMGMCKKNKSVDTD